jgi:hypothetical protein
MHVKNITFGSGYIYLASPYSKYPDGPEAANAMAAVIAARLIEMGLPIYSPIAHSHVIAVHGELDAYSHDLWLPLCKPMIDGAACMVLAEMTGWKDSKGIAWEMAEFHRQNKTVWHMNVNTFEVWPNIPPAAAPLVFEDYNQ